MITRARASLALAGLVLSSTYAIAGPGVYTIWSKGAVVNVTYSGDVSGGSLFAYVLAGEEMERSNDEPKDPYYGRAATVAAVFFPSEGGEPYYMFEFSENIEFKESGRHSQASGSIPATWCTLENPPTCIYDDVIRFTADLQADTSGQYISTIESTRKDLGDGLRIFEYSAMDELPATTGTSSFESVFGVVPATFGQIEEGKRKAVIHSGR